MLVRFPTGVKRAGSAPQRVASLTLMVPIMLHEFSRTSCVRTRAEYTHFAKTAPALLFERERRVLVRGIQNPIGQAARVPSPQRAVQENRPRSTRAPVRATRRNSRT